MAKYRKASEGSKKGISTDKLSLADAKEYFQGRSKETGAKRFRWNGEVYDLSGNKVSEAPARSSGGSRNTASEGPKRPKANPRKAGPAFEDKGRGSAPASAGKSKGAESPGKRGEANPYAVAGMTAAAVGAGAMYRRSTAGGARPAPGKPSAPPAEAPKTAPKSKPKAAPKAKPAKPVAPPKARGGARVGGTGGGAGRNNMDKALDPLNIMNKGGMVKKK